MFQTQIILYLQSFTTSGLTSLVRAITELGDEKILAGILLLITFGVSYRKGILIMQSFQWTLMLTSGFKNLFSMPRPTYVNGNIQNLQHNYFDETPFLSPGAESFFGRIDPIILKTFRSLNSTDYGFPSGHTSAAAALWGGIALVFRKRSLYRIAAVIVLMVGFSRMYLGRHFLGDVVGGLTLAGLIIFITHFFFYKVGFKQSIFHPGTYALKVKLPNILSILFMFVLPLLLAVISADIFGDSAGYLVGANAALLLVMSIGMPEESGSAVQRGLRFLLGVGLFFAMDNIVEAGIDLFHLSQIDFITEFLPSFFATFISLAGTILIGYRLKIYRKQAPISPQGKYDKPGSDM